MSETVPAPRQRVYLPAILGGALWYCCYFPLNLGPLAFIALVPWLSLVDATVRPRRLYFAMFVGGLAAYLPLGQWIRVAHPAMYGAWIGIALYGSVCLVFWLATARWLVRREINHYVAIPAAWVLWEYFRTHAPTGFLWLQELNGYQAVGIGWYLAGHTQHSFLTFIQAADIGGVPLISWLVVLCNLTLLNLLRKMAGRLLFAPPQQPNYHRGWVAATAVLFLGFLGYGVVRLNHEPLPLGPKVAMLQSNLSQDIKMTQNDNVMQHMFELADRAAASQPDLIVWPETALPMNWTTLAPTAEPSNLPTEITMGFKDNDQLGKLTQQRWRTNVLFGMNAIEYENEETTWKYNSAVLINKDGKFAGKFDKIHLVPFGEYVPFRKTFPWMKMFTPYDHDYSCRPGTSYTVFPGPKATFGCLICYENTDPAIARGYFRGGRNVDYFVSISNDGWFKGTAEHEQHHAITRFRAIENRRAVVRAVNMGISGIIDSDGRLTALPGPTLSKSKKIASVVTGDVPIDNRTSFYHTLGDWVPAFSFLVILYTLWGILFQQRSHCAVK
ncbi:MAG: apolipoprotein N-acyltransferase [Zavarzinella sp.]